LSETQGSQPSNPNTAIRRALLWWFQSPAAAHVSFNFAVDFSASRAYLDRLAQGPGPRVTVQHLLAAAVGRSLREFPLANAQIVRNRIVMRDRVGVAMPVNLLGHAGGKQRELGLALIEDAGGRSLREVAGSGASAVREEREGKGTNPLVKAMVRLAEGLPQPAFFGVMDLFERAREAPGLSGMIHRAAPATTLLSNAGAPFSAVPGMLFRGASLSPPPRLAHAGTVWGCSTVQDEAIVLDGQVCVRPMLPMVLIFDHRLIDGVAAGRLAVRFASILKAPAEEFGHDGGAPPTSTG